MTRPTFFVGEIGDMGLVPNETKYAEKSASTRGEEEKGSK